MKPGKQLLYEALTSATVSGLVGGRIYHHHPPKEPALPLITYRQVAGTVDTADGAPAFARSRIEVKIWGQGGLEDIAMAVLSAVANLPCRMVSDVDLYDYDLMCRVKAVDFEVFSPL